MSLLSTLKSAFSIDPVYRKAAPVSTEYFGPLGQRNADWSGIQTGERVRDVWGKCATAFACLTLLADAVAESPLKVYRMVDGEPEEDPNHVAGQLLENPNPQMSGAEFRSLLVMTMGLHGYGAVEKVRSNAGMPVELWPLRPDWLKREYVGSAGATQWVYRVPTRDPRVIADEDLLITPYYHDPSQRSLGLSPLHVVAREVGIDVALTDLLKVFIDAGGIPPWAVEIPDTLVTNDPSLKAKIETFKLQWNQEYQGSQAYRKIGVLYGGMKLVKIGDSIGDMAWPDLRGLAELKIAQAFRVPADLIQARDTLGGSSLTTSEMDGAMAYLQRHGAQPLRTRIDGAFTRGLLPDFTGGDRAISLEFDTSGIMALQEDRDALHTRVRADWQAGLITLNEARIETSRPDLGTGGDVFLQGFTNTLVRLNDLTGGTDTNRSSQGATITPRAMPALGMGMEKGQNRNGSDPSRLAAARVYRDLKALSPGELEVRASVLATTRREREKLIEIGARQLRKFWKAQGERIVGAMPKSAGAFVIKQAGEVTFSALWRGPEMWQQKANVVNWDEEARRLWDEVFAQYFGTVGERAFGGVTAVTGVTLDWSLANPNIGRIMDELGTRIVDISETTRQDVIRTITDGQNEGLNLQQIADSISEMFEQTYKNRALTVARTETQVSYNRASQLGYQESGVVSTVEMVDNPDHDTDPGSDGLTCADRDGRLVEVGQMDRHIEAEHPNGSLAFIPILSKPLGEV